jgi:hypothetical protein
MLRSDDDGIHAILYAKQAEPPRLNWVRAEMAEHIRSSVPKGFKGDVLLLVDPLSRLPREGFFESSRHESVDLSEDQICDNA